MTFENILWLISQYFWNKIQIFFFLFFKTKQKFTHFLLKQQNDWLNEHKIQQKTKKKTFKNYHLKSIYVTKISKQNTESHNHTHTHTHYTLKQHTQTTNKNSACFFFSHFNQLLHLSSLHSILLFCLHFVFMTIL